jgi:ADP-ribose pyrophosphatase YjhB (NUDIX family)
MLTSAIATIRGTFNVEYHDAESFEHLPVDKCTQSYGACFYNGNIILCKTFSKTWILPGGTIEPGESYEQALIREIKEESNMKVLNFQPLGYQKVWNDQTEPFYQLRFYCQVEPYGEFEYDTAEDGGHVESIWQIIPSQAADLLNWGEIGDQIIGRATDMHGRYNPHQS